LPVFTPATGRGSCHGTHHLLLLTATPHMGKDYLYYAFGDVEPEVLTTVEPSTSFLRTQEAVLHPAYQGRDG
jgi:hypothetical protein